MSIHDILRQRLLEAKGLLPPTSPLRLSDLAKSEWSPTFETLMRNRLIMGALRYGLLHAPGKSKYDRIASITKRLRAYQATGNKEFLVDAANLCLLEFEECTHPLAHFDAADDQHHVTCKK